MPYACMAYVIALEKLLCFESFEVMRREKCQIVALQNTERLLLLFMLLLKFNDVCYSLQHGAAWQADLFTFCSHARMNHD